MEKNKLQEQLIAFSETGDTEQMAQLLQQGLQVDFKDVFGRTALMAATQNNQIHAAALLLKAGSNPNVKDHTQLSPFICAGANGFF
ncbi:ankyrin repeat domain-containing protein [Virgibacillus halophilus]|uniref:Ankyrin repeat domain-containing protein n=2 Tax=Tigheibacillus halophilus TaxID=361280 RepID=A0ABU5C6K3_9BACI|nr:ankyrin repeat domain-containing protein [Virgibacillus halophilus]